MVVYQDPEAAKAAINWFNGNVSCLSTDNALFPV